MFTFFLSGSGGWDISLFTYASKNFSVTTQETSPTILFLKPDGSSMYIIGFGNDTVYQYTLSTPWDISTASYASKSFLVTQEPQPYGLFFKHDGTSMYVIGNSNNTVYQYTLSTAWDVSTASYASKSFSASTQDTNTTDVYFKSDGATMYVMGNATDTVYQYTLSTPWDVSTASYASKSFSVTTQESIPLGLSFKTDGFSMYAVGSNNDTIYQYSLSTAWDVSTANYASKSLSVTAQETVPSGIFFYNNGKILYVIGTANGTVYQYVSY